MGHSLFGFRSSAAQFSARRIEIERRWEVEELPNTELLDALAEAIRVLVALVTDLGRVRHEGTLIPPSEVVEATPLPGSLARTRESRRLRINPKTGEHYAHGDMFVPTDRTKEEKAARRYKLEAGMIPNSSDPVEVARAIFPVGAKILQRDGYHAPLLFLHHPDQGWHMRVILMEDKLDKFLMWRRIAEEVEDVGYDGAVFVTEAWGAPPEKVTSPYAVLEHVPGRTELLNVSASGKAGRKIIVAGHFHRRLGRIVKVDPPSEAEPQGPWFLSPLDRAWGTA